MEFVKILFSKVGHLFLCVASAFRRALCCFRKRRRSSDVGLPVSSVDLTSISSASFESVDLQDWEVWNEGDAPTGITVESNRNNFVGIQYHRTDSNKNNVQEEENSVDFFQDMMPSIKKAKKFVLANVDQNEAEGSSENRFGVGFQTPAYDNSELDYLDDRHTTSSWEDVSPEEMWYPEAVFREQKLAERERRLAEHQKRKMEKEGRRMAKQQEFPLSHR